MKQAFILLLASALYTLPAVSVYAQNIAHFYYIIKKKDIDSGRLKLIYRDHDDSIRSLRMCYPKLKAEDLHMEDGVPVFHFERIPASTYDSVPDCISNSTPLGRFEVDVGKRIIGDPTVVARIPFHAITWNASLTLFKIRTAQHGNPVFAVSDPASMLISVIYGYTFGYAKVNHEALRTFMPPLARLLALRLPTSQVKR
ncbi:hypothetical protein [Pontibacter ruber]|uniref:GLPGLI family protein n=1 Tax=Pontibacter ruber TaxID=1343895 RepID=A0ABW5CTE2_9BACT|nr:hypothetical protein [Pontibacter ruber]